MAPIKAPAVFRHTKLCHYNLAGGCALGQRCSYAHCQDELEDLPDLFKTQLCKAFMHSGSCTVPNCTFAHGAKQLRKRRGQTGKVSPGFGANKANAAGAHGQEECNNQGKAVAVSPDLCPNVLTAIDLQITRAELHLRALEQMQFLKERKLSAGASKQNHMAHGPGPGSSDPSSARPWRNAAYKVQGLQVASEHASTVQAQSFLNTCSSSKGLHLGHEMADARCCNSLDIFTSNNFSSATHTKNTFIHFEEMPLPMPRSHSGL